MGAIHITSCYVCMHPSKGPRQYGVVDDLYCCKHCQSLVTLIVMFVKLFSVLYHLVFQVVFNPSVTKKTKSRFFSHIVFKGLSQLLRREDDIIVTAENESEDMKSESTTIKQLTYKLMLQLLTDFHHGIPYRPKEVPPAGLLR